MAPIARPSRRFVLAVSASTALFASVAAHAGSSMPSSVPGITIGNTHVVMRAQGEVWRGSAPTGKVAELRQRGITDVLIFKNATGQEVDRERAELRTAGFTAAHVTQIPFEWKDLPSFRVSCGQIVDGLALLERTLHTAGRKVFFHCTVGEDRTGLLAGLFRMLESGSSATAVFKGDLCAHGYEAGNPHKPPQVVHAIRAGLTPLFLKMANLIAAGKLRRGALSKTACARDPGTGNLAPASFVCAH